MAAAAGRRAACALFTFGGRRAAARFFFAPSLRVFTWWQSATARLRRWRRASAIHFAFRAPHFLWAFCADQVIDFGRHRSSAAELWRGSNSTPIEWNRAAPIDQQADCTIYEWMRKTGQPSGSSQLAARRGTVAAAAD